MNLNILVTIDKVYIKHFVSLVRSIVSSNSKHIINIYVISNDIDYSDLDKYNEYLSNVNISIFKFDDSKLKNAPTSRRYSKTIYYRLFSPFVLPTELDRVLYLDSDIIVKGDLDSLYNMDFEDNYYIGASNVGKALKKFNCVKNSSPKNSEYVNTGVLLMNLKLIREHTDSNKIYEFIKKRRMLLTLPDQDIINGLYGNKIKLIDGLIYNLSDRRIRKFNTLSSSKINLEWVEENAILIHFLGRNKPWKRFYRGILKDYYLKYKVE